MLTYTMELSKNETLYEHLYKCIKQDILEGRLLPGEKLPSKRSFSKNLGISVMTVENAYAQLLAEGYIYSLPQKGFYVMELKMLSHSPEEKQPDFLKANSEKNIEEPWEKYRIDFSSNQTPMEDFPFTVWTKLMRRVLSEKKNELMENSNFQGIFLLRQAIAKHLKGFRGVEVSPSQIVVGAGTDYLYGLLIQLLGTNLIYGVENPGYQKISKIYASHKVPLAYVSMDQEGVCMEKLQEKKVNVIHISPSHHFPLGIVTPAARRYELLHWATEEDHYIVEDDYDSEFRLSGQPLPTLYGMADTESVIYMNTFTKTLSSTMRISYMVLPEKLAKRFRDNLSFYSNTVSNYEQYVLAHFIDEGYFEKHLNRMRTQYRMKRNRILHCLEESELSSKIFVQKEDVGLHFIIKIKDLQDDKKFQRELLDKGIRLRSVSDFLNGDKEKYKHQFVINYSSLEENRIEEIVQELLLYIKKHVD